MANAPIQVILNADGYRKDRETKRPNSAGTDFFEGESGAFATHKKSLQQQLALISAQILERTRIEKYGSSAFIKVSMRPDALAKSHRPTTAIFRSDKAPEVGVDGLGELICEVNEQSLKWVQSAIEKAELTVRQKVNNKTNLLEDAPTRYRCEVSAIGKIDTWEKSDRRNFEIPVAIEWLSDPRSGHVYHVELFRKLTSSEGFLSDTLSQSLLNELRELPPGIIVSIPKRFTRDDTVIEIKVTNGSSTTKFNRAREQKTIDQHIEYSKNPDIHKKLLKVLESHPLVKRVHLPNLLITSPSTTTLHTGKHSFLPPNPGQNYPKVGIIDGGVSTKLDDWIVKRWGILDPTHQQHDHGTFIGGLLVNGKQLNPNMEIDPDGCMLVDIDVFPNSAIPGVFTQYYPNGTSDFFDEIEEAVRVCVEDHGVRIFNISLNAVSPVHLERYSLDAQRLDQIADDYDVIFVISAGNLTASTMRPEWPADHTKAAAILASFRNDQIYVPAESIRNISVAALNPGNHSGSIVDMPARYSRRGPGLRTGVKPDISHYGGSGSICPTAGHGLASVMPSGDVITGCGTSYAAPLAAKMLASLESSIEGDVSRETLTALAIHNSRISDTLRKKEFQGAAQQLVGFGKPPAASDAMLNGDHEITLLFSSRLIPGKALEFKFAWPNSLVQPGGKCQGDVKLTLVSSPPLDHKYGAEFVRVNIEAALQQEQPNGGFKSGLEPTYVFFSKDDKVTEAELIEHKFKWSPVKVFGTSMPKGRGKSSNWRLMINYLTRSGEILPPEGVPFSILLTISDPSRSKPIFQEMRNSLQLSGAKIADIHTAARVTPKV
ncbi:S8 family peptidase [Pseudomonas syringae]|uniref:S8 family peptidase n=5 Tax=Pseudomonas syringae TaxID=317 RepID=UPI001F1DA3A6|nr:S8 family peptidase [Pseudomonas syringae]MCF5475323.1 S8 family serine peptidase [Pseudomonas syringae]MCF5485832.1 S8 family serine peptidase [Pseudomonas syringae]MCF5500294.1 S8 family serine peptidase [Pseudomonas syringae]MCF5522781.1 S8 family serine peptidase [Pseudomonas syringae]MCF5528009.1 S8 family serine peptidase [Pseudomonas syringae]